MNSISNCDNNSYQLSSFNSSYKLVEKENADQKTIEDVEYNSLPKISPKSGMVKKIAKKIARFVFLPLSPLLNIIQIFTLLLYPSLGVPEELKEKEFTPLIKERYNEIEKNIKAVAKKAGLTCSHKIKLYVTKELGVSPAATGLAFAKPIMLLSPEYLLKPEDLPSHLNLKKLENKAINEDQWVIEFEKWINKDFLHYTPKNPKSQLEVDSRRGALKLWLNIFRDQSSYQKTLEFIYGHELGHINHADSLKHCLVDFGWKILSILTGGPLIFLKEKILRAVQRSFEKTADLFSAKVTGYSAYGAKFFEYYQEDLKKRRIKYPQLANKIDENGDHINSTHPKNSERISYLYAAAAA